MSYQYRGSTRPPYREGRRGNWPGNMSRGWDDRRQVRRGRQRSPYRQHFSISISELANLEPRLLVNRLNNQLKEFQQKIGDATTIMADVVTVLLKLVELTSKNDIEEQGDASKIIAEILSERSEKFHFQLKRAVKSPKCTLAQAEKFCSLFESLLQTFQSLSKDCLPMDELLETVKRLTKVGTINSALLERAENLCETRDQIRDKQINHNIMAVDERDDTGYKSLPILPEWKEIKEDNGTPPEVRPNKVDPPYKDWMEYYDIQFRLIREDFIAPLRRGVAAFLQGVKNRDVKIYNRAKIVSQVTTIEKGICFVVKFDASGFCKAKYNWKQSKRLIFGSLLCFLFRMNDEISAMFATVAKRDIYELEKGNIMVHFEGNNILSEAVNHCAMGTEFDIIESNSYFEATSPILKSLQEAEVATMPFTKQLIEGKYESVLPPAYLRETTQIPVYNLSCLHGTVRKRKYKPLMIEVLNKESWKETSDSQLDSSQLNAIQTALTQEISVIQGPPGTGKTYIGLKIVEALLENRDIWDPLKSSPILVMCYTNHALDQFLEGIIDTECCGRKPKVIRVGGRCKNEKVNRYNLSKVREKLSKQHYLEKEKLQCNPNEVWQYLKDYFNRDALLPMYVLRKVVHPYHYYQLTQMAQCAEQQHKEVEVWLDLWHLTSTNVHHLPNEDKDLTVGDKVGQFNDEVVQGSVKDLPELEDDTFLIEYDRPSYEGDDEGYKSPKLQKHFTEKMSQYVHPYVEDVSTYESDNERLEVEFEGEKWVHKANANKQIKQNIRKNPMDDEEVEKLSHISIAKLSIEDRWRLYNYWEEQCYKFLQEENRKMAQEYNEKCSEINELRQRKDQHTLESADVVGMTTTGAAKYQHILHHIKPKIVIVEEAAEVLEAHIVSALSAGTQHLILIGDHKQLRPKPNEHVLATKYNLSISLFERLVRKQMSQATLEIQHRMRPEIAQLVCPHVYEKLLNHESVQKYPDIRGISKNMYFVHHSEPESEHPGLLSSQNEFEAKYIVGLCAHLMRLGYSPSQITILTPYVGQLLLLRDKMPKSEFYGVRVKAIDNFQGEENDIILFSMVRSTNPNSSRTTIGFLKEDNRVCVSLSRAKHGFYAIGNFELIRHQSRLWESIISDVESRECYGNLPLYCCNHPETKYSAQKGSHFKANAPSGGCLERCDIRLPCGHSCTQICHVVDTEHAKFMCKKPCERKCTENHKCQPQHNCCETCPPCGVKVEITKSECGHRQLIECSLKSYPWSVQCNAPCSKKCLNGHLCPKKCSEHCGSCHVEVEKVIPDCNHKQMIPCYLQPRLAKCRHEQVKVCPNGLHQLKKFCSDKSWPQCKEKVTEKLSDCGHTVEAPCFEDLSSILCDRPCERSCEAGHKCLQLCYEKCAPCPSEVKITSPCGHTHVMQCAQVRENVKCPTECLKVNCERGHLCQEECHYPQPCKPCRANVTIQFPTCSHRQNVECYKSLNPSKYGYTCKSDCEKRLQCSHMCNKKCGQVCQQVCAESVRINLECGHETKVECHRKCNRDLLVFNCKKRIKLKLSCGHTLRTDCWKQEYTLSLRNDCKRSCRRFLKCGHPCQEKCGSPCTVSCKFPVKRTQPCGHEIIIECFKAETMNQYLCNQKCWKKLACGHPCQEKCGSPCTVSCKFPFKRTQPCGHEIIIECFKAETMNQYLCKEKCWKKLACGHPCQHTCGMPCSMCCHLQSIRHYPCGHSSKIPCNSTIEAHPCKKKCEIVLSCGHRCSGKCGDCYSSRMHAVCIFEIELHHYSGKLVTLPCAGLFDSGDHKTPQIPCAHSGDHSNCHERCSWDCKHFQCQKQCTEECDRPPCNEICDNKLRCGHRCPGLCGERCMNVCPQCEKRKFIRQFHPTARLGRIPANQPFFELDCGHIFTVGYLDKHMEYSNGTVQPMQCPKCKENITIGSRYGNRVRKAAKDVMAVADIIKEQESALDHVTLTLTDDLIENSQYLDIIQKIIRPPKSCERSCLTDFFNSSMNIYFALQQYATEYPSISTVNKKIIDLVGTLIDGAVKEPQVALFQAHKEVRVGLTSQLLNDFKSELYRLALYAQCLLVRSQYPPIEGIKRIKLTSEPQDAIDQVEQYINSFNPLTQRISEDEYENYFSKIEVAPDAANLHVSYTTVPAATKGVWMTCSTGHYFCVPHVCGPVSKTPVCPYCKYMYIAF